MRLEIEREGRHQARASGTASDREILLHQDAWLAALTTGDAARLRDLQLMNGQLRDDFSVRLAHQAARFDLATIRDPVQQVDLVRRLDPEARQLANALADRLGVLGQLDARADRLRDLLPGARPRLDTGPRKPALDPEEARR